jgi:TM2 domain-containing membrane protein YozV
MAEETVRSKAVDEKFCTSCGEAIKALAEICPKCGVRQMQTNTPQGNKQRIAAALFAILLGGIGIHKFYLGKIVYGIIYLLFCWTFIPAIIGLIEGIIYLTMSDEAFQAKYCK